MQSLIILLLHLVFVQTFSLMQHVGMGSVIPTYRSSFIKSCRESFISDIFTNRQRLSSMSFNIHHRTSQCNSARYSKRSRVTESSDTQSFLGKVSVNGYNRKVFIQKLSAILVTGIISTPVIGEIFSRMGKPHYDVIFSNIFDSPASVNDNRTNLSWSDMEEITLVFHGAGGPDANTDALITSLSSQSHTRGVTKMIDWSVDSGNLLQASVNGINIGERVAEKLASILIRGRTLDSNMDEKQTYPPMCLKRIHIIGISVGAFAAHSFIQQFNLRFNSDEDSHTIYVQGTFLDPLCSKGVLDSKYGEKEFGRGCDYAQQYLNTDDPVPFTNSNVLNCATIDVTRLRPPDTFGHDWPLIFYTKHALPMSKGGYVTEANRYKRGKTITL